MLEKGDIIFYNHRNGDSKSRAKEGCHAWVILHSYTHPLKTYLIAPITSNAGYPNTSVLLKKSDYSNILLHDSYIDLRHITVANEEHMSPQKGLDTNNKNSIVLSQKPELKSLDRTRTDLAAIMALELGQTIKGLIDKKQKEYYNLLKNEIENTLEKILKEIENPETKEKIQILFQYLINNIGKIH